LGVSFQQETIVIVSCAATAERLTFAQYTDGKLLPVLYTNIVH